MSINKPVMNNLQLQKEAERIGNQMIGKYVQSTILTMISADGRKVLEPKQCVTGFEVVEMFMEPTLMLIVGGESVLFDTCINY